MLTAKELVNLLYIASPVVVFIYVYLAYIYLYKPLTERSPTFSKYIYWTSWFGLAVYATFLITYSFVLVDTIQVAITVHFNNFIAIALVVISLHVLRVLLDRNEHGAFTASSFKKNSKDGLQNIFGFYVCYTATFSFSEYYSIAAVILAVLNIGRVLIFRVYRDIYIDRVYHKSSKVIENRYPGQILIRGMLDRVPRAYIYTAFSFTIFQLILVNDPFYGFNAPSNDHFRIYNPSGNPFADFFYFNIVTLSTVGYGDISPITAVAKALTSVEIIFSFIILASLFVLIVGRFQQVAWEHKVENP